MSRLFVFGCLFVTACGSTAFIDSSGDGSESAAGNLSTPPTVNEWVVLSSAERATRRAAMTTAERLALWERLSLEQKNALTVTNAAWDALQANDPGLKPAGSPFAVNEWLTKSAGERAALRPTLVANGLALWNVLTPAQQTAMTVINRSWAALQAPVDLCATSGYPDVQMLDLPVSFNRTVMPYFGNETIMVARFTVSAGDVTSAQALLDASIAEYDGPPTYRTATLSTRPCDFRAVDPTGVNGPLGISQGVTATVLRPIGTAPGEVAIGRTYYFNMKNWAPDFNDGAGGPSCQANTNCRASVVIVVRN